MQFLQNIRLIQGGMGAYVSNWRLARSVAMERPGETAGTVSGTALDVVYTRLLQLGDPGGHVRQALEAFDAKFGTEIGHKILNRFFIEGGKAPDAHFKVSPMHIVRGQLGESTFKMPNGNVPTIPLTLDANVIELLIVTGFAEVWLAKQGHNGNIFINFLHKIELPIVYAIYGAMLAGVDGIIVGAGNPDGLAAACTSLCTHDPVIRNLPVLYSAPGEEFTIGFDPREVGDGALAKEPLKRPAFIAIASLDELVKALAQSPSEPPDGFVIEHHSAGGHNANPVGPLLRDESGQPIYGPSDEPNLEEIRSVGLPFWMAGGYGTKEGLQRALALGATGVQVGSDFALCEESGMKAEYRAAILQKLRNGTDEEDLVRTTIFSPTGFAFKVVQLEGTLSEVEVYEERDRTCDLGMLQQRGMSKPDEDGFRTLFQRCPAGPVDTYVKRRGLERNTEERRCLCNGLLACVGLGQVRRVSGEWQEEPAIVTLGNHLDGIKQLSRMGQSHFWARDVVSLIMG